MKKKSKKEEENKEKLKSKFVYRKVSKKSPRATIVLNTKGKVRSVWRKK